MHRLERNIRRPRVNQRRKHLSQRTRFHRFPPSTGSITSLPFTVVSFTQGQGSRSASLSRRVGNIPLGKLFPAQSGSNNKEFRRCSRSIFCPLFGRRCSSAFPSNQTKTTNEVKKWICRQSFRLPARKKTGCYAYKSLRTSSTNEPSRRGGVAASGGLLD